MNKINCLAFLFLSFQLAAQQTPDAVIRPLSESRIVSYQSEIRKNLTRQGKIRNALIVAGITMTGLSVIKMIREFTRATHIIGAPAPANAPAKTTEQKIKSFATGFAWFCAETAGAIVVNSALSQLLGKIMHDGSLAWWLTTHAPYQQTLELMEESAFNCAHALNQADAARYQNRFLSTAHSFIDQSEQIVAFMRYKSKFGTETSKNLKREIAAVVQERLSAFRDQLQKAIGNGNELVRIIKDFKTELNHDLVKFAYNDQ